MNAGRLQSVCHWWSQLCEQQHVGEQCLGTEKTFRKIHQVWSNRTLQSVTQHITVSNIRHYCSLLWKWSSKRPTELRKPQISLFLLKATILIFWQVDRKYICNVFYKSFHLSINAPVAYTITAILNTYPSIKSLAFIPFDAPPSTCSRTHEHTHTHNMDHHSFGAFLQWSSHVKYALLLLEKPW